MPLAARAIMSAPLADDDALNQSAAAAARLARPPVDAKVILIVALRVHPVNRRAFVPDAVGKRCADATMQSRHLVGTQRLGPAERVKLGPPQRLVGIDVADSGDKGLDRAGVA